MCRFCIPRAKSPLVVVGNEGFECDLPKGGDWHPGKSDNLVYTFIMGKLYDS